MFRSNSVPEDRYSDEDFLAIYDGDPESNDNWILNSNCTLHMHQTSFQYMKLYLRALC